MDFHLTKATAALNTAKKDSNGKKKALQQTLDIVDFQGPQKYLCYERGLLYHKYEFSSIFFIFEYLLYPSSLYQKYFYKEITMVMAELRSCYIPISAICVATELNESTAIAVNARPNLRNRLEKQKSIQKKLRFFGGVFEKKCRELSFGWF